MPAAAMKAESAQYDIGARLVPGPAAATTAWTRGAVQDGARVDGESRVGGSASFDQVGDVGLDVFEGLPGQRSPFDGEHAAVRDGGLSGAAADQGRVQVAWSEERVGV